MGEWLEVESNQSTGEFDTVYNFRVADHHTYFVGTPQWGFGVWVHNTYTTQQMRDAVNAMKSYRNPFTNRQTRIKGRVAADHIFPAQAIRDLKGFDELLPSQQRSLLTDMTNVQPLPFRLNSSKGASLASDWTVALGRNVDPGYTTWLAGRQAELESYFLTRIASMLSGGN